ncbi:response regulator [Tuwongella immobilis]|uniref:Response regulatory domain-containing protein n=1 Tax=Tuwongella immobilis TaxID=692036 RepID=A0A6C2YNW8_9BACT|nr:response regulator [Tuwongella immobilis]VIP02889.1 sensor kinase : Response regulator with CheY-like receiver, AAA-type ATPase, and DNA-binding domains OS=Singulisphaera acidiphila (strain ATCC BAA-1392 / DSM 18658 / VKM B-2454 / MOB10) GN=Sinac_2610 PE=4 SV=1: GAF_2: Response_reg [Tuwongella immobilis]VTS02755.1 sensor kinase : Response regulator with CheY-like receiver, AAA-type ATPase, and DNA-binding domains OS=Singulisphaera acidiphila (strain ATCC BAA-1392 / DSM 18658 / VKM B-2454 / MOB
MDQRPRILIIDDPRSECRLPAPSALGHADVTRVADPSAAWDYFRETPYDAVIVAPQPLIDLRLTIQQSEQRQQKLEALHRAGTDLTALDTDQIPEMNVQTRTELLKQNLTRSIHDLLHFDILEIRLLNRQTGQLVPLLAEGMTEEAANRTLYARPEGNGVTGYVAATGHSYLCPDTTIDPLYLQGAHAARSSLTVPLIAQNEVIGTFNVESPKPNGFSLEDLQFTELFSREIAQALHTLQLLSAQQTCTVAESINAIHREIAMPVDELLTMASGLLDRLSTTDPDAVSTVQRIIQSARTIKQNIHKVGDDLNMSPVRPAGTKGINLTLLKGLRILVVDNEERVRQSAHLFLDRFGCLVETAPTGMEGLALARNATYDVILADIKLPDLRGYETYCRFRQLQPQSRMVLVTGFDYDASHSLIKARQDGLRFVLFKPFRLEKLLDALLGPGSPAIRKDGTPVTQATPT